MITAAEWTECPAPGVLTIGSMIKLYSHRGGGIRVTLYYDFLDDVVYKATELGNGVVAWEVTVTVLR